MSTRIDFWIQKLNLEKHPEGGYFREVYRSEQSLRKGFLRNRYTGNRSIATSIYFLLPSTEFSAFHRLKSDELWHFYFGNAALVHMIGKDGTLNTAKVGRNIEGGELLQLVIPKDTWFAAEVTHTDGYALVGCTVSPGFEFSDFELGQKSKLTEKYPEHAGLIERLCIR
jgi:predicted cupin superfamily sugar epimerase